MILPSEIQMLPKLQFYLKIPEHNPTLIQVSIQEINNRTSQVAAFTMREGLDLDTVVERQDFYVAQASAWISKKTEQVQETEDDQVKAELFNFAEILIWKPTQFN